MFFRVYFYQSINFRNTFFRGTESSGIVGTNGKPNDHFDIIKGHGLVRDVYSEENINRLNGNTVHLFIDQVIIKQIFFQIR